MKLYTKTGDKGETSLWGGKRLLKTDSLVIAYGTVDELNAALGVAHSQTTNVELWELVAEIQERLMVLCSDLATPLDAPKKLKTLRISELHVTALEQNIDELTAELVPLQNFILPGGTPAAAALHLARTICRRAEREVLTAGEKHELNPQVQIYLNRLSDYLFTLARFANKIEGIEEIAWISNP
jgi:cob(I)alamin adenosyltransferase